MRLHRLRLQAFGPFAGVEEVDVDALSEHGLFLLHGPTGAGKTSVLDALCFALYGRVPGARSGSRLRSDHAAAGLAPEVLCDFSAGGRRFEVTRSPAWARPKKRGEGTTTEQARTLLRERVDGEWVARSHRNDEASQLLTDVLGMGMEQFTKVVLLPQGEFAAFLRAPADERRSLLQRLFGTDRFSDVEGWLAEARRTAARELERAEVGLDRLMARVEEAATVLPDRQARDPAQDPVDHVQQLAAMASTALEACKARQGSVGRQLAALREGRAEALGAHGRAQTLQRVLEERRHLESEAATVGQASAALERADAAASVSGHLAATSAAQGRVDAALSAVVTAERKAGGLLHPLADDELAPAVRAAREQVGRLAALLPVEAESTRAAARAAELADTARTVAAERGRRDQCIAPLVERRRLGEEQVRGLTRAASPVQVLEAELVAARQVHAAAVEAARLTTAVEALRDRASRSTSDAQQARQQWLDLREERLAGIAAELAASLSSGEPCPVCGSAEHPSVAVPAETAVTAAGEAAARTASDDAAEASRLLDATLATAREELAGVLSRSGGAATRLTGRSVADVTQKLERARTAAEALADVTGSLVAVDVELEQARAAAAETAEQLAAAEAEAAAAATQARALDERLRAARGEDASVAARHDRLMAEASALESLGTARAELTAARAAHTATVGAATAAVVAAGFSDTDDAVVAALGDDVRRDLRTVLTQHADALAAVRSRLAEPDLVLARDAAEGDPDAGTASAVERLGEEVATCEGADRDVTAQAALLRRAVATLDDLVQHVAADVAATAPLRERNDLVADLARCAEGTGGGNALRMRLSAFVLAARLEQVAAAATARLDTMSSGRYALVHSDALERGGARSGLGLLVVDSWTGHHRETASLSGGEAFMASLALALGLADVVQAEAGGAIIETLFVDEGFGSLDEETLDEVMATLDSLREGGRSVGLVSHVAELRHRIPTRLEVVKTRTGSHLRSRADAA